MIELRTATLLGHGLAFWIGYCDRRQVVVAAP